LANGSRSARQPGGTGPFAKPVRGLRDECSGDLLPPSPPAEKASVPDTRLIGVPDRFRRSEIGAV
jgi:hypothetical protein